MRGVQMSFSSKNDVQKPLLNNISFALSIPSNRGLVRAGQDILKGSAGDSKISALSTVLSAGDDYIQDIHVHPFGGTNGEPSAEIIFKPEKSNDKTVIGDTRLGDLISAGSVKIDIDPNTTNPVLKSLVSAAINSVPHSDILRGNTYTSNTIQKAQNYDYTIEPFDQDPNTKLYRSYVIHGTIGKINPNTGQIEREPITLPDGGPIIGSFADKTPDELKRIMNGEYRNFMNANISAYKQYTTKEHNTPTFDQLTKQAR
jgi:hypothetical protein